MNKDEKLIKIAKKIADKAKADLQKGKGEIGMTLHFHWNTKDGLHCNDEHVQIIGTKKPSKKELLRIVHEMTGYAEKDLEVEWL